MRQTLIFKPLTGRMNLRIFLFPKLFRLIMTVYINLPDVSQICGDDKKGTDRDMKKRVLALAALFFASIIILEACAENNSVDENTESEEKTTTSDFDGETTEPEESDGPQTDPKDPDARIEMEKMYSDGYSVIEIPKIAGSYLSSAESVNADISAIYKIFAAYEGASSEESYCRIISYPCTTDRYINIIITVTEYPSGGSQGDFAVWCYDKVEGRQVTFKDALELAGVTTDGLISAVNDHVSKEGVMFSDVYSIGFRLKKDGDVEFFADIYLRESENGEEYRKIFIIDGNDVTDYDGQKLIPSSEVDEISGLWCRNN